ncbi:hypothetical protein DFA_09223 [Cavenderia fasciculata]|uniref:Uncharacterized protein n=1 Tax=Cavenderia fasciculata TaxID=261658 RepID=F4Q713_CACFS|nr:uncharacterized protein DFA_09223 [Cavenderia fasciculata]EGG16195.1 hypothetical protein DFA_09223 [Cavenderia fasciculata]|eukprot:XP_004354579.1 hypothetical protein DFA_09223 [Cavenderia fasciculata]
MWPVCISLWNDSKESRMMKCPMHRYHYLNDLDPSINIYSGTRIMFTSTTNDKNKWRFQLLNISKILDQDPWNHLNNQYCPIKTPKVVNNPTNDNLSIIGDENTTIFNQVEKLKLDSVCLKSPNNQQQDITTSL